MYIIGIVLILVAVALWCVALTLSERQKGMFEHQNLSKYANEDSEDDTMLLKDIKALKAFAKKLRIIGVVSAFLGVIMFLL